MSSCEFCGALMEQGSLSCLACGSERRDGPAKSREPARRAIRPELEVQPLGPTGELHPGLPPAGKCPRCGKTLRDNLTCTDCVGLTPAHAPVPMGARCAVHHTAKAAFICSRCGSFACGGCISGPVRGYCTRCAEGVGTRASRSSRFWANLLDNFFVVLLPLAAVFVGAVAAPKLGAAVAPVLILAVLGSLIAGCVAQVWAQLTWGQSIGKRMLGIKVVRTNGAPIELWRLILLRNVALHVVAQACGFVGLVDALMIFGDEQRCLHDHFADSIVINAEEK